MFRSRVRNLLCLNSLCLLCNHYLCSFTSILRGLYITFSTLSIPKGLMVFFDFQSSPMYEFRANSFHIF